MSSGRGRRQSGIRSGLRRPRKQPNARLKESVIKKLATLQKLCNCPKEASGRPHSLQHQERSRIVVQWLRGGVMLLQSLLPHLAPTPPAAAEQQLYIIDLYSEYHRIGVYSNPLKNLVIIAIVCGSTASFLHTVPEHQSGVARLRALRAQTRYYRQIGQYMPELATANPLSAHCIRFQNT